MNPWSHPLERVQSKSMIEQRARRMATLAAGTALLAASNPVPAHVKWFAKCEYSTHAPATDVLGRPLFWILLLAAATAVALLRELEHTSIGQALALRVLQVQQRLAKLHHRVLICSTIFFLAAVATTGNLILTPELTTQLTAIRWLQALAATALFARRGEPVAGVVLLALFGIGLAEYGAFHMTDYLIFLGLALYFLLPRWPNATRIRFLRVAAALSLMWVSVEKWVFPSWVMQIVHDHPVITFGFPQKEFVVLAGVVEFVLGFGLMWRGLYSVVSALILVAFMSAAILEFGFVDLVGHIVILGVLLAIALDPLLIGSCFPQTSRADFPLISSHGRRIAPPPLRPQLPTWSPAAALLASCAAVLLVYYGIVYTLHGSGTVAQMALGAKIK
jgi:hypothetical protein